MMIGQTLSHYCILEEPGYGGMPSIMIKYNNLVPRSGRCGL